MVTPLSLSVPEESTSPTTFTVRLRSDPGPNNTALVKLSAIKSSSLEDTNKVTLSSTDTSFEFNSTGLGLDKWKWSDPQEVELFGVQDSDGRDEQARVWLWVASGYPYNGNFFVNVTVDDDEGRLPPGKPGNCAAEPGDGQVKLSWTPPPEETGRMVDKWQLRHKAGTSFGAGDASLWADIDGSNALTTSHIVGSLSNGTAYVFEWRAVNPNGESGGSQDTCVVQTTPALPPAAPSVTAVAGGGQVELSWTAVDGVSGWQVRRKAGTGDYGDWTDIAGSGASTAGHTVTGLTNDETYAFEVRALKEASVTVDGTASAVTVAGAASAEVTATPKAPALTLVLEQLTVDEGGSGTFTVALSIAPSSPVTVSVAQDAATANADVTVDKTSLTFTKGGYATAQTVTVSAAHDTDGDDDSAALSLTASGGGYGSVTGTVSVTVTDDDEPPPPPTGLTATPGDEQVSLNWTDPSNASITQWQVRHKAGASLPDDDTAVWSDIANSSASTTSHTVMGLANDTQYVFEVRAVNAVGAGAASDDALATPVPDPAVEVDTVSLTLTPGSSSGTFGVSLRAEPTGDVTVTVLSDNTGLATVSPASITFTQTNYATAQTVTVTAGTASPTLDDIAAVTLSAAGGGYAGVDPAHVSVAVLVKPPAPANLEALAGDGRVLLLWDSLDPLLAIDQWEVRRKSGSGGWGGWTPGTPAVAPGGRLRRWAEGLTNATSYEFQVRGKRGSKNGKRSAKVSVTPVASGITLSEASLMIDEGGSQTLAVSLTAAPPSPVTVTLVSNNPDVTADGNVLPLTFTADNYFIAQTVTVSAAQDEDGNDDIATLSLNASGGGYGSVTGAADVTVRDDDEPPDAPLNFTATPGDEQVTLSWTAPPGASITKWQVRYKAGARFDSADAAADDLLWTPIAGSTASTAGHTVKGLTNGTEYVFEVRAVNVVGAGAASDDKTATPVASPAVKTDKAAVTLTEGGSAESFDVFLHALPADTVTVTVSSSDPGVAAVSPAVLTFTTGNYGTGQTVTVTPVTDSNKLDGIAAVVLSAADGGYDGVNASVSVAVLEKPPAPANLEALAGDGQVVLRWDSPASLLAIDQWQVRWKPADSQDYGDWTAVYPAVTAGGRLRHTETGLTNGTAYDFQVRGRRSSGGKKNGKPADVSVTPVASAVTLSAASLTVDEGGSTALTVSLTAAPLSPVTVSVEQDTATANADVTVVPGTLTFTLDNYTTPQTVTVSAAHDADTDDGSAALMLSASGGGYDSVTGSVSVTVTDDDELPAQPTGFTATPGDEQVFLSWTDPSNASITKWQVRYKAGASLPDGDPADWSDIENSGASTVSHTVKGLTNGTEYVFEVRAVNVAGAGAASDDKTATPVASPAVKTDKAAVTLTEGGSAESFDVSLHALPADTVTVTVSSSDPGVAAVSPAVLTFTTGNYGTGQTVTVTPVTDSNKLDGIAAVVLSAADGGYDGVSASVSVAVLEKPPAPANLEALAGDGQAVLRWDPLSSLLAIDQWQVRWKPADSENFGNWTLANPAVLPGGRLSHPVSGLTNGTAYDFQVRGRRSTSSSNKNGRSAKVSVTPVASAVTLSAASLMVVEGGSKTLTLFLTAAPLAPVTVTLASNSTDVSVTPSPLTFTLDNYTTPQTVTVSAAHDADNDDGSAALSLSASGGGYDSVTGSVSVTVDDDDETPDPPLGLMAIGGYGQAALSWIDPQDSSITKWQVRSKPTLALPFADTDSWKDIDGSNDKTTGHTVDNLTNGTEYTFEVRAENDDGAGAASTVTATPTAVVALTLDSISDASIAENTAYSVSAALTGTPGGPIGAVNWTLGGADADAFTLSNETNTGVTVTLAPQDYEAPVDTDANNTYIYTLTATDEKANTVTSSAFTVTVTNVDEPPGKPANFSATPGDTKVTLSWDDPSDATITKYQVRYAAGTAVPDTAAWADIDGSDKGTTAHIVKNLTNGAEYIFEVRATNTAGDGPAATITATPILNAPTFGTSAIPGQSYTQNMAVTTLTLPEAAGGDGTLTYSLSPEAPDGLIFDAAARTLSGTPAVSQAATPYTYTAADGDGDTASLTFNITIAADNMPSFGTETIDDQNYTRDTAIPTLTLPTAAGGDGTLTYALGATPALPAGLAFDAAARTLTGVPTAPQAAAEYTYTATDGDGDAAELTFNIRVAATLAVGGVADAGQPENAAYSGTATISGTPVGNVTWTLTGADGGSFTLSNETNTGVTVTLAAQDFESPADAGANNVYEYTLTATDGDNNTASADVAISITNVDETMVVSPASLSLTEGGSAETFTVALAAPPPGTVTVAVGVSSNDTGAATVSPASLTFTAGNYNTTQTVTVTPVDDADAADETVTVNLDASGGGYDTVSASVTVTVDDDETAEFVLSATNLSIGEDGSAQTYTVALTAPPPDGVTVTVDVLSGDVGAATVSPAQLTFTVQNYDTAQTVTVTPLSDADAADETVMVNLSASAGGYDGVGDSVSVAVDDDETAEFVLSATNLSIEEDSTGGTNTYTVALTAPPPEGVTVTVDVLSGDIGAATVSPAQLTFTAQNYDTAQTVTVTPLSDADAADETVMVNLGASAGGYDGVGDSVSVAVDDDETAEFVLSATNLSIEEDSTGGTNTYTVALTAPPPEGVTVTVDVLSGDIGAATVSPAQLTFTAQNYDTAQTVTVTPLSDADAADETLTVSLGAAGGGYDGVGDSVSVAVDDDDHPPTVDDPIEDKSVIAGSSVTVDVSSVFSDPDGDPLTYEPESDDTATATVSLDGTTLTVTGVAAGDATVTVTAKDPGNLSVSDVFSVTVHPPPPGPVTGLSATAGDDQVTLSWSAPTSGGQASAYEVRHKITSGGSFTNWLDVGLTYSHPVTGLTNGTVYTFEVRATNSGGAGPAESVDATPVEFGSFTVALTAAPTSNVTLTVSSDDEGAVDGEPFDPDVHCGHREHPGELRHCPDRDGDAGGR